MARKPEAVFVSSVNKHVPKHVYHEGISQTFRGGTPDRYYEGNKDVMWVEYKFTQDIKRELVLTDPKKKPALSPLQQRWLKRAHGNGRKVAVIVGCPQGGVILPGDAWLDPISKTDFESRLVSRNEVAQWIEEQVHGRNDRQTGTAHG